MGREGGKREDCFPIVATGPHTTAPPRPTPGPGKPELCSGAPAAPHLHGIQRQVARDLKLLPENLLLDVVDAHELGHPPCQDALAVRRVAEGGEGPAARGSDLGSTRGPAACGPPTMSPTASTAHSLDTHTTLTLHAQDPDPTPIGP